MNNLQEAQNLIYKIPSSVTNICIIQEDDSCIIAINGAANDMTKMIHKAISENPLFNKVITKAFYNQKRVPYYIFHGEAQLQMPYIIQAIGEDEARYIFKMTHSEILIHGISDIFRTQEDEKDNNIPLFF